MASGKIANQRSALIFSPANAPANELPLAYAS